MQGCIYLKSKWEKRNGVTEKVFFRCNWMYGLTVLRFYNPDDLKDCNDILLCELHLHETFDPKTRPMVKAESRVSYETKSIARIKKELRDKNDWEILNQFSKHPFHILQPATIFPTPHQSHSKNLMYTMLFLNRTRKHQASNYETTKFLNYLLVHSALQLSYFFSMI